MLIITDRSSTEREQMAIAPLTSQMRRRVRRVLRAIDQSDIADGERSFCAIERNAELSYSV